MSLIRRFFLNDGLVHLGAGRDGPSLCGVTISKYRRSTDADITCATCKDLGPVYGVNVGPLPRLVKPEPETELVDVDLRCMCGHYQRRRLEGDAPVRATLAALSCDSCGRLGCLTITTPPPEPDRELPPHPEEP